MKESAEETYDSKGVGLGERIRKLFVPESLVGAANESAETTEQQKRPYGDRLAELDFLGRENSRLKKHLARKISFWEKGMRTRKLCELSENMGLSEDEVALLCQERIEELMQKSHFFCATSPDILINHIFGDDRRFKSQVEIDIDQKLFGPSYRNEKETEMFGLPSYDSRKGRRSKSRRPIYGYFSLNADGIFNEGCAHPPRNTVCIYGRATIRIKREVALHRATMCLNDTFYVEHTPISPVALPHYSALFHREFLQSDLEKVIHFLVAPINHEALWGISGDYTEVQYHGGLTVDDIESVHLSLGNGLEKDQMDSIAAAVAAFNHEAGSNIPVVMY